MKTPRLIIFFILIGFPVSGFAQESDTPDEEAVLAAQAAASNAGCTSELMKFCHSSAGSAGSGDLAACVQANRTRFTENCLKPVKEEAKPADSSGDRVWSLKLLTGYSDLKFKDAFPGSGTGIYGGGRFDLNLSWVELHPEAAFVQASGGKTWLKASVDARLLFLVLHDVSFLQSGSNDSFSRMMGGVGSKTDIPFVGRLTLSAGYASFRTDWSQSSLLNSSGPYVGIRIRGENASLEHELTASYAALDMKSPTSLGKTYLNLRGGLFYGFGSYYRYGPEVVFARDAFLDRSNDWVRIGLRLGF
jgi:hypothetical protein